MSSNQLANETSPYLLQHAQNPVHWYPWGQEALNKARETNKLILLSIGYSACHWCHVMAHESFEAEETAEVMNKLFVNIKVDREERPDLDKIYQTAHYLLNQRAGGWPLTAILTPDDRVPFFIGTYFPNTPRHGMPSFVDMLHKVDAFYHEHEHEIRNQNKSMLNALQEFTKALAGDDQALDGLPLDQARSQLEHQFDTQYGGFGGAPKFPHPTNIEFLMRYWSGSRELKREDDRALELARFTLHAMASGGIYDQLGGGFCRYSVDQRWTIPHFEKMLYDNGPLLALYAQAYVATGDKAFQRITRETADWVIREMQSPKGGYYSTLDADSEGQEGKFYAWSKEEVSKLLTKDERSIVDRHYGLNQSPNFEGHWHLRVVESTSAIAKALNKDESSIHNLLQSARQKMFDYREGRIRPGRDEKILTSWNGLMIKGMAIAGRTLNVDDCLTSATRAVDFIYATLFNKGRLQATYKDGKAHLNAYLDDYVFLLDGLLELLQSRWRDRDLDFAKQLADVVLTQYEDRELGGFFFTAHDHEPLIQRPKPFADEAIPAGNGVAAYTLARLGHLLGETRYLEAAERTLKIAWQDITGFPHGHGALLIALQEYLNPVETFIIRSSNTDEMSQWSNVCQAQYSPRRMVYAIPDTARTGGLLIERKPKPGKTVAYVCQGTSCQPPIENLNELQALVS